MNNPNLFPIIANLVGSYNHDDGENGDDGDDGDDNDDDEPSRQARQGGPRQPGLDKASRQFGRVGDLWLMAAIIINIINIISWSLMANGFKSSSTSISFCPSSFWSNPCQWSWSTEQCLLLDKTEYPDDDHREEHEEEGKVRSGSEKG